MSARDDVHRNWTRRIYIFWQQTTRLKEKHFSMVIHVEEKLIWSCVWSPPSQLLLEGVSVRRLILIELHSKLTGYPGWRQCPLCTLLSEQEAASLSQIRPVSSLQSALPATPWPCDPVTFLPLRMAHTTSGPGAWRPACDTNEHTHTHSRALTHAGKHATKSIHVFLSQKNGTSPQLKNNMAFPGTALECWSIQQTQHSHEFVCQYCIHTQRYSEPPHASSSLSNKLWQ